MENIIALMDFGLRFEAQNYPGSCLQTLFSGTLSWLSQEWQYGLGKCQVFWGSRRGQPTPTFPMES